MKIIKIIKNKYSKSQIDQIVDYLNSGKILVLPTDTIYGLSCDATNEKAIKKIIKLKKRNKSKGLIVLVSSVKMAKEYCLIDKVAENKLAELWKNRRPTTVLLRRNAVLPDLLSGGGVSLAIRLPKRENLVKIIERLGAPIVSTSLNISGGCTLSDVKEIEKVFNASLIDLAVDCGQTKNKKPSKILDITNIKKIKVIRT
jgi:L-threonylcarbamoyladenylate synthase